MSSKTVSNFASICWTPVVRDCLVACSVDRSQTARVGHHCSRRKPRIGTPPSALRPAGQNKQNRPALRVASPAFSSFLLFRLLPSGGLTYLLLYVAFLVPEKPGSLTAEAHPSNRATMTQLPSGAEGTASGVLIWAFICLFSNLLIIWLLVLSKEKASCKYSPSCQVGRGPDVAALTRSYTVNIC